MILYHRTSHIDPILADGFRDDAGDAVTGRPPGVWLADAPVSCPAGAPSDALIVLELPIELLRQREWREEGRPRTFVVPARTITKWARGVAPAGGREPFTAGRRSTIDSD